MATSSGKIILLGEHAVVYGQPAMAVPFRALQATATVAASEGAPVWIEAPDLGRRYRLDVASPGDPLALAVRNAAQRLRLPLHGLVITVRSTLPVASGLGSGAAVCTALVRALAEFAGQTLVLCLASGCQQQLARSLDDVAPVSDALVHLDSLGERLRFRSAQGRRIALHLPCSQRVLGGVAALRRLLARVPELDLLELPDTGCCGAAGLHMLEEPGRAARLREPLLAALARSGAVELLSANIGCRLHLAGAARMPVRHPIDFLAEHLA